MRTDKGQFDAVPKTVPRDEFNRILGNLISADPMKRKDARTGEKKKQGLIIPPKPQSESGQR
jgi:hypothetical protein